MQQTRKIRLLSILTLCFACSPSLAAWNLNGSDSSFHFVTSKNAAISEINTFMELSGEISNSGEASLLIPLASVESYIDIRNERMREMLFNVDTHPQARATLSVDTSQVQNLSPGSSISGDHQVTVTLHGVSQNITANLTVTKLTANRIKVEPAVPLIISADRFNLGAGVEALREIAGLTSINHSVVIDFSLIFDAS